MLARIRSINGIGRLECGHTELTTVTLIYGRNGAGKSTLADVLRSVDAKDDTTLKLRCQIKPDGSCVKNQALKLSFSIKPGESESPLEYASGAWSGSMDPCRIKVFDTAFIEANVFTGSKHEHKNKQALTELILGEKAVAAEKDLRDAQDELNVLSASTKTLEASLEKRRIASRVETTLPELTKPPSREAEDAASRLADTESKIAALNKVIRDSSQVRALPDLETVAGTEPMIKSVESLIQLNAIPRPVPDASALAYVRSTVLAGASDDAALEWLRTGWGKIPEPPADQDCPFCGQKLGPTRQLLDAYAALFDETLRHYQGGTALGLNSVRTAANLGVYELEKMQATVARNAKTAESLRPYLSQAELPTLDDFVSQSIKFGEGLQASVQIAQSTAAAAESAEALVKSAPSEAWKTSWPNAEEATTTDARLLEAQTVYAAAAGKLQTLVTRTRESAGNDPKAELEALDTELQSLRADLKRHEWQADLTSYADGTIRASALRTEIPLLKGKVLAEQESFVATYFVLVNTILQSLTGHGFEVVHEKNKSGTEPVYGICLLYRGQRVDGQKLPFTLSDGDRRSLALAIFLATVDQDADAANCIIVLDDPVTSLDVHRRRETVKLIAGLKGKVRQVIVISHFKTFLAKMVKRVPGSDTTCLQCKRDGQSSKLVAMAKSEVLATEHDMLIEKMQSFADGNDDGIPPRSLLEDTRVVIEEEIRSRYRLHLDGFPGNTLGSMLDHLAESGVLAGETLEELRYINSETSELHHEVDEEDDPDDARTVVRRAMKLLFDTMVAQS